jgi:hypothetical protein
MVTENKQNIRYKQINFIGLQNNRHPLQHTRSQSFWKRPQAPDQGSTVGGLLSVSVSPPEEHHERRTFCRRGGYPRTCDSGSAIDS